MGQWTGAFTFRLFFLGKTKGALNYTIPQDGIMIVLLMLKL